MIVIDKLSKSFNGKKIIDDFTLNLPDKGRICLYGPSGSGKTTLLNIILGLVNADSGHITGAEHKKVSCIFQEDRLLPWLSAVKNVEEVMNSADIGGKAEQWLKAVQLEEDSYNKLPEQLSGGMNRRVSIARALAFEGDFIIMDEPFKGLDDNLKTDIINLVRKETEEKLLLFITHDYMEAESLADCIYKLEGPPLRIRERIITNAG